MADIAKDFFTYSLDFAIGPGESQSQNISIQADSNFVIQKLCYQADMGPGTNALTNASRIIPLVTLLITDSGSGRQLMSAPVSLVNLFGTGEIPFILPQPKMFVARSTVTVTLANFSASNGYHINLAFIGTKIFQG